MNPCGFTARPFEGWSVVASTRCRRQRACTITTGGVGKAVGIESGKMQRMKESYGEGLASHAGSESCGHGRKAGYEA